MAKRKPNPILPEVHFETTSSKGLAIGRYQGKVVMAKQLVPGDIAEIQVTKKRKNYLEGFSTQILQYSSKRTQPVCEHFGTCGGCKWQNMTYDAQLQFKEQQVRDQLQRIGHLSMENFYPILASPKVLFYRNKLEFTFSNRKWLTQEEIDKQLPIDRDGLGFHVPGSFDKVLDINTCHLQSNLSNEIRNFLRAYAKEHKLTFFDLREQHGFLRNLIIRTSELDECLVILSFFHEAESKREALLNTLISHFSAITSLFYVINSKKNDSLYDQRIIHYHGKNHLTEKLGPLTFKIGPKSFFQTNTQQAYHLYHRALELADIQETDTVYDIYCGTGTISCFLALRAKRVIGVEVVEEAIVAAKENARMNNLSNVSFHSGLAEVVLNQNFFNKHGSPDIILVDPPRAGLHKKVIDQILRVTPNKLVYISCNPATQARDLEMMSDQYNVIHCQPVDMFPQTHHVENIAILELK
jgi:23S rRNA (uracil1939-C5)-methyltransferase